MQHQLYGHYYNAPDSNLELVGLLICFIYVKHLQLCNHNIFVLFYSSSDRCSRWIKTSGSGHIDYLRATPHSGLFYEDEFFYWQEGGSAFVNCPWICSSCMYFPYLKNEFGLPLAELLLYMYATMSSIYPLCVSKVVSDWKALCSLCICCQSASTLISKLIRLDQNGLLLCRLCLLLLRICMSLCVIHYA